MTNAPNSRKWWSTVQTEVFDARSSLPPLSDIKGKLVCSAIKKASVFSAFVDAKQCRGGFQQPHSCGPSQVRCSVALQPSSIYSLLLDLDPYGGKDPDGMFPIFYKQVVRELAPKLAVVFRHLVKGGIFTAYWRVADVVSVPKGSASSDVGDYESISITSLLSKVFQKILVGKLSIFLNTTVCFLRPSFVS